MSSRSQSSNIA